MLLLCALIFRAVSMEFRSKLDSPRWRSFWDGAFFLSSTVAALLFGVAGGNAILGIPIGADKEYAGSFFTLLRPYPILVGLFVVALFAMHGAIYLTLKTEGELQRRVQIWARRTFFAFLSLYLLTTIYTLLAVPSATKNFAQYPWAWLVVALNVLAIANIPRELSRGRMLRAFIASCGTIAAFNFLFGIALFPNLLVSSLNPEWSLTISSASSSMKTLAIMRNIAFLGMPFVLAYTSVIYWVFKGRVEIGKMSY
jgi:cytochrome d ubiquinol oxidase subunit II